MQYNVTDIFSRDLEKLLNEDFKYCGAIVLGTYYSGGKPKEYKVTFVGGRESSVEEFACMRLVGIAKKMTLDEVNHDGFMHKTAMYIMKPEDQT